MPIGPRKRGFAIASAGVGVLLLPIGLGSKSEIERGLDQRVVSIGRSISPE
jgi:hypothetical protein